MDFRDDFVLMGHDGPGHIAISQGRTKVRPLAVYHGKAGRGLSVEMSVKHGPVTLLSLAEDADSRFKLLPPRASAWPEKSWKSATPTAATDSRWAHVDSQTHGTRRVLRTTAPWESATWLLRLRRSRPWSESVSSKYAETPAPDFIALTERQMAAERLPISPLQECFLRSGSRDNRLLSPDPSILASQGR